MSRGVIRRWAALLLVVSLGSGYGLQGLDAWFHHREPTSPAPIHIDPPGGCDSHAERCIATASVGAPRLALATPAPLLPRGAAPDTTLLALVSRPRGADVHTLQQPRAPPTDLG